MIKGIDISKYQSAKFNTSGLDFVFIKATEGTHWTNSLMHSQASGARAAKLVLGYYHFLRPGDIAAQAQHFVSTSAALSGDLLAGDWEDPGVSCAQKDQFLREVKKLRPHNRVLLYCNVDYWRHRDTTSYAADGLWIADYGASPGHPRITSSWKFHQYSDRPVDSDLAQFSSRAALQTWAGQSGTKG
ncbi:glycoside hydrolase family 25 protein [Streptomyces wuyuanensis]|uniref:glycoside hydrolase family 25 protein n=1 Tax=Streptomyces wuyuanensis TaxID=1196353 RepID=UPI003F5417ED